MLIMALLEHDQRGGLLGLLTAWVDRRTAVTLEREHGRNLRQVLDRLPAGYDLVEQRSARLHTIKITARGATDRGGAP
jgi:hypothetical protein